MIEKEAQTGALFCMQQPVLKSSTSNIDLRQHNAAFDEAEKEAASDAQNASVGGVDMAQMRRRFPNENALSSMGPNLARVCRRRAWGIANFQRCLVLVFISAACWRANRDSRQRAAARDGNRSSTKTKFAACLPSTGGGSLDLCTAAVDIDIEREQRV